MTFDEIVSRPRRFRVERSTAYMYDKATELIGKELELKSDSPYSSSITLLYGDEGDSRAFNRSDVSELTPLSFEGRGIAIGDEVRCEENWYKVYGFHWYDGEWSLDAVKKEDFERSCSRIGEIHINGLRTPHDAPPRTVEQVLASLPDADKAVVMRALVK